MIMKLTCGVLPLAGLDPGCHRSSAGKKKQLCAPSVLGTSKLNPIPHGHTRWVPSLRRYHIGGAPDFHAWTWRALDAMGGA